MKRRVFAALFAEQLTAFGMWCTWTATPLEVEPLRGLYAAQWWREHEVLSECVAALTEVV